MSTVPEMSLQPSESTALPTRETRTVSRDPSIISIAVTVIGQLESAADIQIDGKVEGDVLGHNVKIGTTAVINGSVFGEGVEVAGTIDGKIEARNVVLIKGARMTGEIVYQSLQLDADAFFEGDCRPHFGKTTPASP
jgi:cytoskeletal protein CcmA (bactofilin family)